MIKWLRFIRCQKCHTDFFHYIVAELWERSQSKSQKKVCTSLSVCSVFSSGEWWTGWVGGLPCESHVMVTTRKFGRLRRNPGWKRSQKCHAIDPASACICIQHLTERVCGILQQVGRLKKLRHFSSTWNKINLLYFNICTIKTA